MESQWEKLCALPEVHKACLVCRKVIHTVGAPQVEMVKTLLKQHVRWELQEMAKSSINRGAETPVGRQPMIGYSSVREGAHILIFGKACGQER